MIIYDRMKRDFLGDIQDQTLAVKIENSIFEKMHRKTGKAEFSSWENSLQMMALVLMDDTIPEDAGIAIEYNIPQTAKRVDFIISGYDREKKESVIIIELKQWGSMEAVEGKDGLVQTFTGGALRTVVHPSYQAWSYATLIRSYNDAVQDGEIHLFPCAFLHNYQRLDRDDPLDATQYAVYEKEAPAFSKGEARRLQSFIRKYIQSGDEGRSIYRIDHGKVRPSRSLQDEIVHMVERNDSFVMIDDQKVVYEEARRQAQLSHQDQKKRVLIVRGGPGTGKTVVAVHLLAALTAADDQFVRYVTKNTAPRQVYKKMLKGTMKLSAIDLLFTGSDSFFEKENNCMDTVLVDEAHRLTAKSGMFRNQGENQIREIIHAAKCSVFFIDEEQKVTIFDIGTVDNIKTAAELEHAEVTEMSLTSQFRCNGSDGYLSWLDQALMIRETANYDLHGIDYDFRVFDDPKELYEAVKKRNEQNNKARIVAGYCWNWPKEKRNDPQYKDIRIGDFEMSWNFANTSTWAIDPHSFGQAGCIHTCQGLEFDVVGVLIGDDLRYEDGKVITDYTKRASTDQSLKGIKSMAKKDPQKAHEVSDVLIRNTYRTLMTRGMKGCYVYCTDKALAQYLKGLSR